MKIIISGGGTGGHIYPALAIADEFLKRDPSNKILYVGKEGSLEEELAKKDNLDFSPIHISGLPRKKVSFQTIKTLHLLSKGYGESKKIIKKFKPDIVIGTGGYVCAPIVMAAQSKKIKTVIQEQNAYPGKTNRLLSKKADLIALNFEEAKKYFENENIIFTGNPIRDDFNHIDKKKSRDELGIGDEKFVLSFGGSGGQESTNDAILDIIKSGYEFNFKMTHITGRDHYEKFMRDIEGLKVSENLKIEEYSHDIPRLLMASDLVIASSSAMTLAEISAVGVASILIPKAYTAGNHQYYNAKSYESKNASIVIEEMELNGEMLYNTIEKLLGDDKTREDMAKATKCIGNSRAVVELVDEIERLIL